MQDRKWRAMLGRTGSRMVELVGFGVWLQLLVVALLAAIGVKDVVILGSGRLSLMPPCRRRQKSTVPKLMVMTASAPRPAATAETVGVASAAGTRLAVSGDVRNTDSGRCWLGRRMLAAAAGGRRSGFAEAESAASGVSGVAEDDGGVRAPHVPSRCRVPCSQDALP